MTNAQKLRQICTQNELLFLQDVQATCEALLVDDRYSDDICVQISTSFLLDSINAEVVDRLCNFYGVEA